MSTKPLVAPSRTWGTRYDSLPASSPSTSPGAHDISVRGDDEPNSSISVSERRKDGKMPHDASVFVGSLPVNMDQAELAHLLSVHLSEHAQVKNVKVVRDSKGGVCAFVQCENAAAASSLINTLHSSEPKPFLGRILRYEPARAFRTLLVSYRIPTQFIPNADNMSADGIGGKHVELKLPDAMRLWKPRNSKYLSILYNSEAVEAESHASVSGRFDDSDVENALHLQPVTCDEASIRVLCSHFGQLDTFKVWAPNEEMDPESEEVQKLYPYPHQHARKSDTMDGHCFEVKWTHRDDCVNALMTLRRVPHLTVTWAHQPNSSGDRQLPYQNSRTQDSPLYPVYIHDRMITDCVRGRTTTGSFSTSRRGSTGDTSSTFAPDLSHNSVGARWRSTPINQSDGTMTSMNSTLVDTSVTSWGDTEFPPLGLKVSDASDNWSEKKTEERSEAKLKTMGSGATAISLSDTHDSGTFAMHDRQFATDENEDVSHDVEQELDMPPTPGLSMGTSPITPRTPSVMFPPTPTSGNGEFHGDFAFADYDGKHRPTYRMDGQEQSEERCLDPTTLFVGGLEMFGPGAWDEEKVGRLFKKFGGLESVKVVRPVNGKAAFAFVKFNNTESPARAVSEEHNQIYEGRAMRVQLRDCNPPRGNWKYNGRGRGRYPMHGTHRPYGDADMHYRHREQTFGASSDGGLSVDGGSALLPSSSFGKAAPTVRSHEGLDSYRVHHSEDVSKASAETSAETYREWYDNVPDSATMTPPPAPSQPAAAALNPVSSAQFPVAPAAYYPSPPWVQPFGPHMQYPVAFYGGYPGTVPNGYSTPQPPSGQGYSSNTGSDASGPASTPTTVPTSNIWPAMGMYGYFPYPPFPSRPPLPAAESANQSSTLQAPAQAPVIPSGFIQNEQGTLIPVYPPEAIDQYMSAGGQTLSAASAQSQTNQSWLLSHGPRMHLQPGASANASWMPNQPAVGPPVHSGTQQSGTQPGVVTMNVQAFRGGHDLANQQLAPSFRRNSGRRESYGATKVHLRPAVPRTTRANFNANGHSGFTSYNDAQQTMTLPIGIAPFSG